MRSFILIALSIVLLSACTHKEAAPAALDVAPAQDVVQLPVDATVVDVASDVSGS